MSGAGNTETRLALLEDGRDAHEVRLERIEAKLDKLIGLASTGYSLWRIALGLGVLASAITAALHYGRLDIMGK